MTHVQDIFVRNLRFFRSNQGYSQIEFSVMIDVSPNYLNAIENSKNFPSVDVIQRIVNELHILPYQLFLEQPSVLLASIPDEITGNEFVQEITDLQRRICADFDEVRAKICKSNRI